ncbi:MAG: hypothetical protein R3F43_19830 [bacterium]
MASAAAPWSRPSCWTSTFRLAGDDGILEFTLPLTERGDHLLRDLRRQSAAYVVTTDVQFE